MTARDRMVTVRLYFCSRVCGCGRSRGHGGRSRGHGCYQSLFVAGDPFPFIGNVGSSQSLLVAGDPFPFAVAVKVGI